MAIIIIATPKYNHQNLNIKSEENLFEDNYEYYRKFSKPFSIIAVIKIFIELYKFLKLYNNNYRPIYHMEHYILFLLTTIHDCGIESSETA